MDGWAPRPASRWIRGVGIRIHIKRQTESPQCRLPLKGDRLYMVAVFFSVEDGEGVVEADG